MQHTCLVDVLGGLLSSTKQRVFHLKDAELDPMQRRLAVLCGVCCLVSRVFAGPSPACALLRLLLQCDLDVLGIVLPIPFAHFA